MTKEVNYKEKLRELLCEVPEIKKDLEELRFGTYLYWRDSSGKLNYDRAIIIGIEKITLEIYIVPILKSRIEKIENPIEERHIRMYYENKKIKLSINNQVIDNYGIHILFINNNGVCEINNNLDFNNQSEEVYQKIYEALISL